VSVAAGVRIGASSRAMRVGLGAALLEIGDQLGLSTPLRLTATR
jgi:hypothetical protein